jgi:hypothetical protein
MVYKRIIIGLLIIFLSTCKTETNDGYVLSFESTNYNNSKVDTLILSNDKRDEILRMHFGDDGELISFIITDSSRPFSTFFNFFSDSIASYGISDEPSNYGNATTFSINDEIKLMRMEYSENFLVTTQILNNGSTTITTTFAED